jgi:small subunit ribosomal protein S20
LQINRSALKRNRQNHKRRIINKSFVSEIRTVARKIRESVEAKKKEDAEKIYKEIVTLIDGGVTKGLFHRNNAARKKSRLYKLVNSINTAS